MNNQTDQSEQDAEKYWRNFLLHGFSPIEQRFRPIFGRLPSDPRCKICLAPFKGYGSSIMRAVFHKKQSLLNPAICNYCEENLHKHLGGAEVELTMLFADVRSSTSLAERMSISEFRELIDRFFQVGVKVLSQSDAYIDKLIGDEVSAGFVPGIAGPDHARRAISAAQEILRVTGHEDPGGPWVPVGVGVHTGIAYVGTVGSKGNMIDFTALGDAPNVASRLASNAAAGEVLVSEEAWNAAGIKLLDNKPHQLQVKGRSQPVYAHSLRVSQVIS